MALISLDLRPCDFFPFLLFISMVSNFHYLYHFVLKGLSCFTNIFLVGGPTLYIFTVGPYFWIKDIRIYCIAYPMKFPEPCITPSNGLLGYSNHCRNTFKLAYFFWENYVGPRKFGNELTLRVCWIPKFNLLGLLVEYVIIT